MSTLTPGADPASAPASERPISALAEVALDLAVEMGRTTKPLRDVLRIGPGEIITLDRPAGAPADLYVNGTLFARGQIVEAADSGEYAIRVTELVAERPVS